jgi:hypothetical protein
MSQPMNNKYLAVTIPLTTDPPDIELQAALNRYGAGGWNIVSLTYSESKHSVLVVWGPYDNA